MEAQRKRLIIIDANSLVHRAFHALPLLTTKKGELVNAIYGFLLVFLRVLKELKPDFIAAAFDLPFPTFRHEQYKEYKATRPKTPEELGEQLPKVKEILKKFNVPIFEKQGFEADDVIGTIVFLSSQNKDFPELEIIIASGDTDTLQLADKNTKIYYLRKGVKDIVLYDKQAVEEKYQGILPSQLSDVKGLKGDASDNIPGVFGIGEKTAIELIKKFGTIENLYQELENNSEKTREIRAKTKEALLKHKEQAFSGKTLVQLRKDVPIDFSLEKCSWQEYDKGKATELFEEFEFYSLIERLP